MPSPSYYERNRSVILEKARRLIVCDCGARIHYSNRSAHRKTVAHRIWVKAQPVAGPSSGGESSSEGPRGLEGLRGLEGSRGLEGPLPLLDLC